MASRTWKVEFKVPGFGVLGCWGVEGLGVDGRAKEFGFGC